MKFDFADSDYSRLFSERIIKYIRTIGQYIPIIDFYEFNIKSSNNFPHSSGISSSASSFSALALCLAEIEQLNNQKEVSSDEKFYQKASLLARLGSGSACRSIFGGLVLWGATKLVRGSSDEYATPLQEILAGTFQSMNDTILILDKTVKSISSSAGHDLMEKNPYSDARYRQAEKHLAEILTIIKKEDLDSFFDLIECEALELHAMMLTSFPGYILMKPSTISVIEMVRSERKRGLPVGFTLDAGANIHLLYPSKNSEEVLHFITDDLVEFHKGNYIKDCIGNGPTRIQV